MNRWEWQRRYVVVAGDGRAFLDTLAASRAGAWERFNYGALSSESRRRYKRIGFRCVAVRISVTEVER